MLKKKYVKAPISEEITEDGGAVAIFVDKETIPLETSIKEAMQGNYTLGQETLIKSHFNGLMQSMIAGLLRDGHPRTLGNLIKVFLVAKGDIDLEKGWDEEVNTLRVRARLLNELEIDVTDWVFEDVTVGKRAFTLTTVKAGDVTGEYALGQPGEINGNRLPNTEFGEEMRVDWAVEGTDKAGTLDASLVTSDATRIDIDADALSELLDETYDGKTIVFTVRGNFSNAKISAKLVVPDAPTVVVTGGTAKFDAGEGTLTGELDGENLDFLEGDTLTFTHGGESGTCEVKPDSTSAKLKFACNAEEASFDWVGTPITFTLKSRGGVATAPTQTVEKTLTIEEA